MKNVLILGLVSIFTFSIQAQSLEKRTVGEYDEISVSGWFDVELVEGKEGQITLTGKASQLKHIESEVVNGDLKIEWGKRTNINPFYSFSKITITIPVESIHGVSLSGSGSISGSTTLSAERFAANLSGSGEIDLNVNANSLNSRISGSGNIIFHGQAENHDAEISGSGKIKAYDLETDIVVATISGSANVNVKANKEIRARISGSGDVNYIGSPDKIDSKVSGSGSVTKRKRSS
ncbi:head GIN domain-containing protein [Ulvibacterium sp.]|uniref:head GIN domain-containing protein n=1 Tax=Ulvibacterium sp. TaxID=2665914 RepID=UPI003BAA8928